MITAVKVLSSGFCRHLLSVIDRKTWKVVDFPAVFLVLYHATEGWILVDTGYGSAFASATERFPQRFYRWVTPVTSVGSTAGILSRAGIQPADIRHIIITHFHADHVGGLAEFAHARIHYHEEALAPLLRLPAWRQVRAAFLSELVPAWLPQKANVIPVSSFTGGGDELPFPVHDLFGDGSLQLAFLPGHAPGQIGLAFQWQGRGYFYAADAYWREAQIVENIDPYPPAMWIQWDPVAYRKTVETLRRWRGDGRWQINVCHDGLICDRWGGQDRHG